ncbi:type II toxin-antitoxin system RatA family toxin [Bombella saccharophila]|uniref:Type II toxin-antitoxin system RatA family toxin n=1 Tax=Bombella saccharophila TaxID=2967338 RepID=A0ABT3W5J9_9PROT|nr:type II toxin-antitoxin system RatA family toxin [Bombella saccharophila]MCX5614048.1 type II toxin-antitoxin system RatA family toxin [Bombella saccharophila]
MPTHAEQRLIPYSSEQLFDLVADIEKYPEFLPWCVRAAVRSHSKNELLADLTIGFGPFRETYTSRVQLDRPHQITVGYERGPFKHLKNIWRFTPEGEHCRVDFFVDFEFRSRLLGNAIGMVFNEGVRLMVKAFITQAGKVYGPPRGQL